MNELSPRIPRKRSNSSKTNLTFSVIFHGAIIILVVFFAAREGILGKKLKQLTVIVVPKVKELPKEKPPEPKVETPKTESAKTDVPQPKTDTSQRPTSPPPSDSAPAVAPAVSSLPAFDFNDGAHQVETISDPKGVYKALVEHALRSQWNRPEDLPDETWAADVEVSIDSAGRLTNYRWISGSGNRRWDDSVKTVLSETKSLSHPPPKGFPLTVHVRFDVESIRTETLDQFSSQ